MPHRSTFRAKMVRPATELVVAPLALDPLSAALAVRTGFEAVYLGGGGLGYARAVSEALLTTTEMAEACRQMTERVDVAVVVDGGVGFGDALHMARMVRLLEQAGAAGVEIEDQVAPSGPITTRASSTLSRPKRWPARSGPPATHAERAS